MAICLPCSPADAASESIGRGDWARNIHEPKHKGSIPFICSFPPYLNQSNAITLISRPNRRTTLDKAYCSRCSTSQLFHTKYRAVSTTDGKSKQIWYSLISTSCLRNPREIYKVWQILHAFAVMRFKRRCGGLIVAKLLNGWLRDEVDWLNRSAISAPEDQQIVSDNGRGNTG